jgi:L-threonylcarbamoyladenylate synthase
MKIINMNPEDPDEESIHEAIDVLASGGVILYPTDTVYGLGANVFNQDAVKRIYKIKNRDFNKPLSVSVSSINELLLIAEIRREHRNLVIDKLPGPFTFVLYKTPVISDKYISNSKKIGVRIPKSEIAIKLSQIFPITSTSANLSSKETLETPKKIAKQLNADVDLAIDVGPLASKKASTVVDLTKRDYKILRQGVGFIS